MRIWKLHHKNCRGNVPVRLSISKDLLPSVGKLTGPNLSVLSQSTPADHGSVFESSISGKSDSSGESRDPGHPQAIHCPTAAEALISIHQALTWLVPSSVTLIPKINFRTARRCANANAALLFLLFGVTIITCVPGQGGADKLKECVLVTGCGSMLKQA